MRRERLRVELRLHGELKARFEAITWISRTAMRGPFRYS
jgi:hypothetical protein